MVKGDEQVGGGCRSYEVMLRAPRRTDIPASRGLRGQRGLMSLPALHLWGRGHWGWEWSRPPGLATLQGRGLWLMSEN